jgi:hypothetical protein
MDLIKLESMILCLVVSSTDSILAVATAMLRLRRSLGNARDGLSSDCSLLEASSTVLRQLESTLRIIEGAVSKLKEEEIVISVLSGQLKGRGIRCFYSRG